jgi:hypothetical protein
VNSEQHHTLEALHEPVCVVCQRAAASARRALDGVLRDGVNDVAVRDDWRRRGGLCAHHWRVWRHLDSPPLSTAILTDDLLTTYLERGAAPPLRCPACEIAAATERRSLTAVGTLPLGRLDQALAEGPGFVCLRHLEALPEGSVRERFHARLEQLVEHLREQVRTSDHRYANERRGPHEDAWLRALRAFGADV